MNKKTSATIKMGLLRRSLFLALLFLDPFLRNRMGHVISIGTHVREDPSEAVRSPSQTMMKLAATILVFSAVPAFAAELPPDLAKAVKDYYQAQFHNDIPALKRLVSDDYVLVNSDATVENKQKVLADHSLPGFKIDPYIVEQPVDKVWGNAAVIGGVVHLSWTRDGKHQTRLVRVAYIWAKRDGHWQTTYTQVTRVPQ